MCGHLSVFTAFFHCSCLPIWGNGQALGYWGLPNTGPAFRIPRPSIKLLADFGD